MCLVKLKIFDFSKMRIIFFCGIEEVLAIPTYFGPFSGKKRERKKIKQLNKRGLGASLKIFLKLAL